jgi:hypothetical protein
MWVNSHDENQILDGVLQHYRFPSNIFGGSAEQLTSLNAALIKAGRREIRRAPVQSARAASVSGP